MDSVVAAAVASTAAWLSVLVRMTLTESVTDALLEHVRRAFHPAVTKFRLRRGRAASSALNSDSLKRVLV